MTLGIMQRATGSRASKLLGISDETVAFDFDRCVSASLYLFERQRDVKDEAALGERQAILTARSLAALLAGRGADDEPHECPQCVYVGGEFKGCAALDADECEHDVAGGAACIHCGTPLSEIMSWTRHADAGGRIDLSSLTRG
jgi:hypothetical protein